MEYETLFSWDRIPQLYRLGHKRSLTLKCSTRESRISDEISMALLELVDKGVNFQILDTFDGGDFLENFRKRMDRESR